MMAEAGWAMSGQVPSMEEYMEVRRPSFALGPIVLTSLYFIGPEIPEDVVRCQDYNELFGHMNVCGRLLNDLQSYEREKAQGKVNSVLLLAPRHDGSIEAAKRKLRTAIEAVQAGVLEHGQGVPPVLHGGGWLRVSQGDDARRERGGA
ncbi:Ent-kaurene synthase-like 3 [Dichanthelium oligosanthes]|uniref:Ent-kaurene synthase-like 3 n=1 Tax=Dichanthelium oligosanthes TaxID=888268 RepID=A0A1E5V405_9POAL|nr:Ent-kaurene synthase-like 3 [Dichanthelium oligosanthes]